MKHMNVRTRRVFIGLCVYYFVAFGLIYNGLGMFLSPISLDLKIPFVQVSMTSTVRILVGMVTTAAAGRILPRVKLKWFLSMNVLILFAACCLMATANTLVPLMTGSALMGFAAGFALYAIVPIILNQWFENPTKYVSIATAAGGAGGILFCPMITTVISSLGWRAAYFGTGLVILCVMLPLALGVIRYSPKEYGVEPYSSEGGRIEQPKQFEETVQITAGHGETKGKRYLQLWIYMCLFFVGASILSGMYGHIASALWAKGFSNHQVGLLTSVYQFGTTVVQLLFGMISLKLGLRKTLNITLPFVMFASVGLIFSETQFALTALLAGLLGIGRSFGTINPILTRYVFGAEGFDRNYSVLYAVFLIGTAATATLYGACYNITGSYQMVYILILVCTIAMFGIAQLIFNCRKKGTVEKKRGDSR